MLLATPAPALHPKRGRMRALLVLAGIGVAACSGGDGGAPPPAPVAEAVLTEALSFPGEAGPPDPAWRPPRQLEGYTVRAVALDVRPGFRTGALSFEPAARAGQGAVLVAHGHFGGGKSATESQEVAHRLAARGTRVLVVDNPGMEEWEGQGRELHFEGGAHNRALLASAGTSAMGLQLAALQAGLDLLEAEGHGPIVATGASGGAVQAFWLALLDARVRAVALAAVPSVPREVRASGCACDQVPGLPGPDPAVLAALEVPSLWLKDSETPRAEGLPASAIWSPHPGPHSYTEAMQREAVDFLEEHLGQSGRTWLEAPPLVDLRSAGPHEQRVHRTLAELLPDPGRRWQPQPWESVPWSVDCRGEGPAVLLAGEAGGAPGEGSLQADRRALREAGLAVCTLSVPEDETGAAAAFGRGLVYADRFGGALRAAVRQRQLAGVYAVRAWGLVAGAGGVPFVVREPLVRLDQVRPELDPPWVHVPGAWWGAAEAALDGAIARGEEPAALATALSEAVSAAASVDKGATVP